MKTEDNKKVIGCGNCPYEGKRTYFCTICHKNTSLNQTKIPLWCPKYKN